MAMRICGVPSEKTPGFIHAIKGGHVRQEIVSDFPGLFQTLLISSAQAQVMSLLLHYTCTRPQHNTETQGPMGVWTLVQTIIWKSCLL